MYDRLEGNIGKVWDCGRDRDGTEPTEYCESLFLEACDMGRARLLLRNGADVVNGGSVDRFWLEDWMEEAWAVAEVVEDEVSVIAAIAIRPSETPHKGRAEGTGEPQPAAQKPPDCRPGLELNVVASALGIGREPRDLDPAGGGTALTSAGRTRCLCC